MSNSNLPKNRVTFVEKPVIKPSWLLKTIHPEWVKLAERLCQIQVAHNVSHEDMSLYIDVASGAPIPFVIAVEKLAKGDWIIEIDETTKMVNVKDAHPIIIPTAGEVSKFKKT
jgi:hypothetical protein